MVEERMEEVENWIRSLFPISKDLSDCDHRGHRRWRWRWLIVSIIIVARLPHSVCSFKSSNLCLKEGLKQQGRSQSRFVIVIVIVIIIVIIIIIVIVIVVMIIKWSSVFPRQPRREGGGYKLPPSTTNIHCFFLAHTFISGSLACGRMS